MSYMAPYIDSTGMHIPSYADIRDDLISKMKQIFGSDIYIDEDSMDYQQISIMAKKIYDTFQLSLLTYNNRTPNTAIGTGLDNAVVYGNIVRKPATYSIVQLTITGSAGTVIENGEATDGINIWNLPSSITIPSSGTITVECTCSVGGNVGALPNSITTIVTPVYGWTGVTNNYAATPGTDVETDASLRARFARAVESPSSTVFDSIWASLENIEGVTRVNGYENDTNATSTGTVPANLPSGLPAHSITFVVEGGEDADIATQIYLKKTPGCYTNGTTETSLTTINGNVVIIRYYRPTSNTLFIKLSLKALPGYNQDYLNQIKAAIIDYVSTAEIGDTIYRPIIWSVATSVMSNIKNPAFSVTNVQFSADNSAWTTNDFTQDFYKAAFTTSSMITIEVS